jgi:hypothetical protein
VISIGTVSCEREPLAPAGESSRASGPSAERSLQPEGNGPFALERTEGTLRMVVRLAELAARADPATNPFLNRARAAALEKELAALPASPAAPTDEIELRLRLAAEWTRAGDGERAAGVLDGLDVLVERLESADERSVHRWLRHQTAALAWLRVAENENCIERSGCAACLFPIAPEGVHAKDRGSRRAIGHFELALRENPQDLASVWLWNIAAMTLGEHPGGVPERFRIPPSAFASRREAPRFRDRAEASGCAIFGLSGGAAVDDFDGDGLLDIVCSAWGLRDPLRFLKNLGDGRFDDRSSAAGLDGIVGGLNLNHADYDGDGDLDLLVLRGAWLGDQGRIPNSLLRNRGDGSFDDVTEEAGILSFAPTQTAAWADYDLDGDLDLFIGNESDERGRFPCELYRNRGDGTFLECAAEAGVDHVGFVKGVAWGDLDGDRRPDLYLSRLAEPNVLLRNVASTQAGASPRFVDVTAEAGVAEPWASFPTWFFDFDSDGDLDIFVASYGWTDTVELVAADSLGIENPGETPRLYENLGAGRFRDRTRELGLDRVIIAMGANHGDLDGDGNLDIYLGTGEPSLSALFPNRAFLNVGDRGFADVTAATGLGHLQKGHGVAFADIDGDGDEDIYTVLGGAYEGDAFRNALFENPGSGLHWITLRLRSPSGNRFAVGARVDVRVAGPSGERRIHREVGTGGSFGSSSLDVEVGLGDGTAILAIEVAWPGPGTRQEFGPLAVDRVWELREGVPEALELPSKAFRWPPLPKK